MIKILTLYGDKTGITKKLYSEAFSEDGNEYIDYFYRVEAPNNIVYTAVKSKKTVSMLQLHPFKIRYNNDLVNTYYIVAVATLLSERKKGIYKSILIKMLNDIYNEIPFVFLMPANEDIYRPFNFKTLVNIEKRAYKSKDWGYKFEEIKYLSKDDICFMNNSEKISILKDDQYFYRIYNSLEIQGGTYVKVFDDKFLGILRYINDDKNIIVLDICKNFNDGGKIVENFAFYKNVEEIIYELNDYEINNDNVENKLKYMYRIVNIYKFINILRAKKKLDKSIKIVDKEIEMNNGIFKIVTENDRFNISETIDYEEEMTIGDFINYILKFSDIDAIPFIHEVV